MTLGGFKLFYLMYSFRPCLCHHGVRLPRLDPLRVGSVGHGQAHRVVQLLVRQAVRYPLDDPLPAGDIQGPALVDHPELC